jgi:hypothetical protein
VVGRGKAELFVGSPKINIF